MVPVSAEELPLQRQRLKSRVMAQPQRLDLREHLAAVYRLEGHLAQAGRWNYLSEDQDSQETRAFTRAFQNDPVEIMRALRWTGSEDDAETDVARERLAAVRAAAGDRVGRPVPWEKPDADERTWHWGLGCAGLLVLVVLALVVVGAVSTVRWIAGF